NVCTVMVGWGRMRTFHSPTLLTVFLSMGCGTTTTTGAATFVDDARASAGGSHAADGSSHGGAMTRPRRLLVQWRLDRRGSRRGARTVIPRPPTVSGWRGRRWVELRRGWFRVSRQDTRPVRHRPGGGERLSTLGLLFDRIEEEPG